MVSRTSLEILQAKYLDQLLKGNFQKIELSPSSTQLDSPFESLFEFETEYNFVEEVNKTIVCQWLESKKDDRFKFYIKYYLLPDTKISLDGITHKDITSLISPQNIENSLTNFKKD